MSHTEVTCEGCRELRGDKHGDFQSVKVMVNENGQMDIKTEAEGLELAH